MSAMIGIIAIALIGIVILIAAASLLIVGTMPFAKLLERRRSDRDERL